MNNIEEVSVSKKCWWRGFQTCFLVRIKKERAIKVIVGPFPNIAKEILDEELAVRAAGVAYRHRWKTIVVWPDLVWGEEARAFNPSNFPSFYRGLYKGEVLCQVGIIIPFYL